LDKDMNRAKEVDIELTPAALEHMRASVLDKKVAGIRLSVREAGCSGLEYIMDYAVESEVGDYVKAYGDFSVFIDADSYRKALCGLRLDYQQDALSSGFVFSNPNKKGECGCGQSFTV